MNQFKILDSIFLFLELYNESKNNNQKWLQKQQNKFNSIITENISISNSNLNHFEKLTWLLIIFCKKYLSFKQYYPLIKYFFSNKIHPNDEQISYFINKIIPKLSNLSVENTKKIATIFIQFKPLSENIQILINLNHKLSKNSKPSAQDKLLLESIKKIENTPNNLRNILNLLSLSNISYVNWIWKFINTNYNKTNLQTKTKIKSGGTIVGHRQKNKFSIIK